VHQNDGRKDGDRSGIRCRPDGRIKLQNIRTKLTGSRQFLSWTSVRFNRTIQDCCLSVFLMPQGLHNGARAAETQRTVLLPRSA